MYHPQLRILVDVDGVMADFLSSVFDFVERRTGHRYYPAAIKTWEVFRSIEPELERDFDAEMGRPGFCRSMRVLPHAKSGIELLKTFGEVFVVTSPPAVPNWEHERREWLKEHFDIDREHVVSCPTKHIIPGDLLIDDKPDNLVCWEAETGGKGLLWDAPYNRENNLFHRVYSWEDVVQIAMMLWERTHSPEVFLRSNPSKLTMQGRP